jgi:uncharacterized OB-fold protein
VTSHTEQIASAAVAEAVPFMPDLFEAAADGGVRLLGGRCSRCGTYSFPRRSICSQCGPGPAVEPAKLDGHGRIYASTVVCVPSPVGLKPPYAYGYVDLDSVPLRVFGLFAKADAQGLQPGTPVRLVSEALYSNASGQALVAYKFTRIEGEAA